MKKRSIFLFTIFPLLIFCIGCSEEQPEITIFTDRIPQGMDERIILADLSLQEVVNLTEFDVFNPPRPKFIGGLLMWADVRNGRVAVWDPGSPDEIRTIGNGVGEGPGEVGRLNGFARLGDELVVLDGNHYRLLRWRIGDGTLLGETAVEDIRMYQIESLSDEHLVVMTSGRDQSLFYVTDGEGVPISSVADSADHLDHLMKSAGYMTADEETFYYAGYSEPILRRYNSAGELLYSRSLIDDYDTSDFYTIRTFEGGGVAYGFAEHALYSAIHLQYYDGVLIVSTYHNGDHEEYFLDLYDSETGEYIGSWRTDRFLPGFAVREGLLYGFYRNEEEDVILGRVSAGSMSR